ncbi:PDZ domain-containing protein [candidate division GN15 bacterium]|nr:PDZ domain-containing protein [candidate division GN15 bacterium]
MSDTAEKTVVISRAVILWSLTIMALMVIVAGGMAVYVLSDPGIDDAITLRRAALTLANNYKGDLDTDELISRGRAAMFEQLDRYSSYVPRRQMLQRQEELSGGYYGIGVIVVSHDRGLLIMSVRENGPAAEAGVLPGDIIIEADTISLTGMTVSEASTLLRGPEGTQVEVGLFREAINDTTHVSIERRRIELLHLPFAGYTADSVLYMRLFDFQAGASDDIEAALDSLLTDTSQPRGIILDLRGNPGGLMSEAFEIANLFLEENAFIVGTDSRSRWNEYAYHARGDALASHLPMAILVDRGSASAAEIVAGALRYNDRAILVGDTTFGKGLVQGFWEFPGGDGLRLTISRYYFEGNVFLNDYDTTLTQTGRGLPPDYHVEPDYGGRFGRELDNSLLLQRFVSIHLDSLVAAWKSGTLDTSWIERLAVYARTEGFTFQSPTTEATELFGALAQLETTSNDLLGLSEQLTSRAEVLDSRLWLTHAEYIFSRMERLLVERHLGMYEAYRTVIVPRREDIRLATKLLLQQQPADQT